MSIPGYRAWEDIVALSISCEELEGRGYEPDIKEFNTTQLYQDELIVMADVILRVQDLTAAEAQRNLTRFLNLAEIGGKAIERRKGASTRMPASARLERERLEALPLTYRVPASILIAKLEALVTRSDRSN